MTTYQLTAIYTHGLRGLIGAYALTVLGMGLAYVQRRSALVELCRVPLRAVRLCALGLLTWAIGRSYLDPVVRWGMPSSAWAWRSVSGCPRLHGRPAESARQADVAVRTWRSIAQRPAAAECSAGSCNSPASTYPRRMKPSTSNCSGRPVRARAQPSVGCFGLPWTRRPRHHRRSGRQLPDALSTIRSAGIRFSIPSTSVRPVGRCLANWKQPTISSSSPALSSLNMATLRTRMEGLRAGAVWRHHPSTSRREGNRSRPAVPATDQRLRQGAARPGRRYGRRAVSRIQQCPHVRCDSLGAQRRGRYARSCRNADRPATLGSQLGALGHRRAVPPLLRRTNRRPALADFRHGCGSPSSRP